MSILFLKFQLYESISLSLHIDKRNFVKEVYFHYRRMRNMHDKSRPLPICPQRHNYDIIFLPTTNWPLLGNFVLEYSKSITGHTLIHIYTQTYCFSISLFIQSISKMLYARFLFKMCSVLIHKFNTITFQAF